MDKAQALQEFYANNRINAAQAADEYDCSYDPRIAQLPAQIDQWLSHIDEADHDLFLNLLSRFSYLNLAQCQIRYKEIVNMLTSQLTNESIDLSEVLFITVESSHPYKSGADNVRADFYFRNIQRISKEQIITAQTKLDADTPLAYKAIVFIDDIVGSGCTLFSEIHTFFNRFPLTKKWNPQLYYACIVPFKKGLDYIQHKCKNAQIPISPLYNRDWCANQAFKTKSNDYLKAYKYEDAIGNTGMTAPESFFMGFCQNKLLVSFYYNTPNNTLSTFWRVVENVNAPPFPRDGNQPAPRPSVKDLQKVKQQSRQNAYAFGAIKAMKGCHHE